MTGNPVEKPTESIPAVKHARDNDDETLYNMFSKFSTIEILQEIAARMADDENCETIRQAKDIGIHLSFDKGWCGMANTVIKTLQTAGT